MVLELFMAADWFYSVLLYAVPSKLYSYTVDIDIGLVAMYNPVDNIKFIFKFKDDRIEGSKIWQHKYTAVRGPYLPLYCTVYSALHGEIYGAAQRGEID